MHGDVEIIREHLQGRGSPNLADEDRFSLLHEAAYCRQVEIVRLLITAGAGVNVADENGRTALFV